jgi:hypothetical protein
VRRSCRPFLLEVGISSSYHIAKFFGLTIAGLRPAASTKREIVTAAPKQLLPSGPAAARAQLHVLDGEVLDPKYDAGPEHTHIPPSAPIDISAVITKALKAAGLMKGR